MTYMPAKRQALRCRFLLPILSWMLLAAPGGEAAEKAYFFPFVNPFEATVLPLPSAYEAKLPEKIPVEDFVLKVFPDRKTPDVFWYQDGLVCSMACQDHKAPLIFIIAGTGAHYASPKMVDLQKVFYQAGFHVICISSPTHMNFIVNACSGMPGNTPEDAKDLYRVMEMAAAHVRERAEISWYALTGYSLGGIESAFLAKLDDERKVFNFKRVLLINPPVNVYTSISLLDGYLRDNIP
jgi:predicted alpha/beta-fold hydrolase